MNRDTLLQMTVKALRLLANKQGILHASRLVKAELVEALAPASKTRTQTKTQAQAQ